jgi:uncharacterized tellurite resistance protein B-like protein
MDKPGNHNIRTGLLWLIVGLSLTLGTYALLNWKGGFLFYGAVLVGGIQLIVGIGQRIQYALLSTQGKAKKQADVFVTTLLRCMAIAANADGKVEDTELQTMGSICHRLLGFAPDLPQLRQIVQNVGHGGADPEEFVASLGTQLDGNDRYLIAKACYLVLAADAEVVERENKVFMTIINGLRIRREDVYEDLRLSGILRAPAARS